MTGLEPSEAAQTGLEPSEAAQTGPELSGAELPGFEPYPVPPEELLADDGGWRRLDGRTVLAFPFAQAGPIVLVVLIALIAGGKLEGLIIRFGITFGVLVLYGAVHLWRFRYRIIDGRLETRSGLIGRTSKVINVDRIRGIEVEAKLAHRITGVCALRIEHPGAASGGRGRGRDSRDRIDAISHAEAQRLRTILLHERARALQSEPSDQAVSADFTSTDAVTAGAQPADASAEHILFRMPARWLLYSPFSGRLLLFAPITAFITFNALSEADVRTFSLIRRVVTGPAWPVLAVIVIALFAVTAVLAGALAYWRWTVSARGSDIVLTRGLLTRRTVAIEQRRMRGVVLREPLPGRPFSAATLEVVISGITGSVRSALIPLGPRQTLVDFGDAFVPPGPSELARHPAGAKRRRLRRALAPSALIALAAAGCALAGEPDAALWLAVSVVATGAVGWWWGLASYRALGHALDGRLLVARHGVAIRHTETVERSTPIGLRVRQSVFARRAGVASIDVALVARGFTRIPDVDANNVEALAAQLIPEFVGRAGSAGRQG